MLSRRGGSVPPRRCVLVPLVAAELTAFTAVCLFVAEHGRRRAVIYTSPEDLRQAAVEFHGLVQSPALP